MTIKIKWVKPFDTYGLIFSRYFRHSHLEGKDYGISPK